jgi:MFS family permease
MSETEVVAGRGASSTMQFQHRAVSLRRGLTSLGHRDFRLFWTSQILSLIGTWVQVVAQDWLVLELSDSPFTLGVVSALQFLPTLFLSMFGGVVADRLPRRALLLFTQSSAMTLAFVLGTLTWTGTVQVVHVMVLAVLLGTVNSLDMPTRQAFVVELVGREDLQNAIALNSAAFNSARLIGPAIAGLAIGRVGLAGCFFLNGLSFLAVIGVLLTIRAGSRPVARGVWPSSVWGDLREGLEYVVGTPVVRLVILMMAVVGTFGMNLNVLIPVLARDTLQVGAEGYGFLSSAIGLGSLSAALLLASLGRVPRWRVYLGAAAALGILQMLLLGVHQYVLALPVLAGVGFSMIFFTTLSNTVLQTSTPDALRGRVMSVYTTVFVGSTPLGSLFAGGIAENWGVGAGFFACGAISLCMALVGIPLSRRVTRP